MLYALGVFLYLIGFMFFGVLKSSIHEIVALLIILNGTVFIASGAIISAIKEKAKKEKSRIEKSKTKLLAG
ncbi:hypothetical protein [Photobacterium phosphoreum]|uniref:hypothetical protein n=1 Tax=Photobacterium phosphoreum TaxID=659 RepID=UPI001E57BD09|nr:hypothetical protein [Photobacterium phosphoreum]MCD9508331.1 hypothetical protein [Photobacterium phosphoreum]